MFKAISLLRSTSSEKERLGNWRSFERAESTLRFLDGGSWDIKTTDGMNQANQFLENRDCAMGGEVNEWKREVTFVSLLTQHLLEALPDISDESSLH